MPEASTVARPKGRPKGGSIRPEAETGSPAARVTIINLKGSEAQADWLDAAYWETRTPKAEIVRAALEMWGKKNGRPPFPTTEE
jgi:hypothetical protein